MTSAEPRSVLVALSGGVDSSVCVHLLRQRGLRVEAAVCDFSPAHLPAVAAAEASAAALQVPLHVVDCRAAFYRRVITYFAHSYRNGRTPNPCVVCNPAVKFEGILRQADALGFDAIATGHYAAVARLGGRYVVQKAGHLPRDQSYMLYRLKQDQLARLILPLSAYSKGEVRAIAAAAALPSANAPDSQEICFIPDGDYPRYIREHFGGGPQGCFISPDGEPCGAHNGLECYTVGQRKGLGVALGRRVSVRYMEPETGNIYLADYGTDMARRVAVSGCVYLPFPAPPPGTLEIEAKIRSQARPVRAVLTPGARGHADVAFRDPQRAPAPGQSCVFYRGDTVIGGGFIRSSDAWRKAADRQQT